MSPRKRALDNAPPERPKVESGPPPRTRMMGEEERRRMIEAHIALRPPDDPMRRLSLWAGVMVCVLAIGAGWVYAMRQSIANAIQPTDEAAQLQALPDTVRQSWEEKNSKSQVFDDIDKAKERIGQLQQEQGAQLQVMQAVNQVMREAASTTPADKLAPVAKPALPKGVQVDTE